MNIRGKVIPGSGRARTLGFPTLNIPQDDGSVTGIFAATVLITGRTYHAAVFADRERKILEAYLLDFDDEIEAEEITINLVKKIRDAQKFTDDTELQRAIAADVRAVREHFKP